jgi:nucleotide-binding universal stress UspA family protein
LFHGDGRRAGRTRPGLISIKHCPGSRRLCWKLFQGGTMNAILVPVDGSPGSLRAARHAVKLARRARAVVHLLNVEPPLDDYGMVGAYLSRQQHNRAMRERAAAVLRRARRALGARCETHAAIGDVAPTIVATARRLRCDSIVMGTRGMGAVGNLALGSVATKVVHLSRVPVTLVR